MVLKSHEWDTSNQVFSQASQSALHWKAGQDENHYVDAAPDQRNPSRHPEISCFIDCTKSVHEVSHATISVEQAGHSHKADNAPG